MYIPKTPKEIPKEYSSYFVEQYRASCKFATVKCSKPGCSRGYWKYGPFLFALCPNCSSEPDWNEFKERNKRLALEGTLEKIKKDRLLAEEVAIQHQLEVGDGNL